MKSLPSINSPSITQILRSNRKSFGLEIKPDGRLIVRAPQSATQAQIEAVVAQKAGWITKTQARLAAQAVLSLPKTFAHDEKFWYLGEQYHLRLTSRQRPLLDLDGTFNLSRSAHSQAREVFIAWYREETRQITRSLIETYKKQSDFKVNKVRVTSARTRWGSCSGKGNLNFTYRLCMAPFTVVEYVVVHELIHLKIPNHSRAFWSEVARINPTYQKSRAWFKKYGHLLNLD